MFEFEPGVVVWTLISFAIVYLFVHRAVLPTVRRTLDARRRRIEQSVAEAEAKAAEARQSAAELEERLRRLQKEEQQVLVEARERARQFAQEQEQKTLEEFRLMRKNRESDLKKMEEAFFDDVRGTFSHMVIEACQKILKTELTPEQQRRIVEERIAELERVQEL